MEEFVSIDCIDCFTAQARKIVYRSIKTAIVRTDVSYCLFVTVLSFLSAENRQSFFLQREKKNRISPHNKDAHMWLQLHNSKRKRVSQETVVKSLATEEHPTIKIKNLL